MNHILEEFTREALKHDLAKLPSNQQHVFKRMYSHTNLDANINAVVDDMEIDNLDWALQQVRNSLKKPSS